MVLIAPSFLKFYTSVIFLWFIVYRVECGCFGGT
jgi:hypothetical protein